MALDRSTKTLTIGRAADTVFRFRVKPQGGAFSSPEPAEFRFYVKGKAELTQIAKADPADPTVLFLEFDEAYAKAVGSNGREFQLLRTLDGKTRPYLEGTIVAQGFAV